jgi:carbon storage regulator
MLVLTRKVGERVLVGDKVAITVVRIQGNAVRLGIEAPPEMTVVREELAQSVGEKTANNDLASPLPLGEG